MTRLLLIFSFLVVQACGETVPDAGGSRILLMGDSLMASNRGSGDNIAQAVEETLGEDVVDRANPGARMLGSKAGVPGAGLGIPGQYREGNWDWVIVNGYGNDVMFGCGCGACAGVVNQLISEDGKSGAIPDLVAYLRGTGARVIWVGYLRSPGFTTPVESCGPIGDRLDARIRQMAADDPGVSFVNSGSLVPSGDRSFHGLDLIHPSAKGSRAIAAEVAAVIRGAEG